jgi:acyl transferase domain-containing protein
MNAHKGIVNRLLWMQQAYPLTPQDRLMQKTPYSFDVSVPEFFGPLLAGATIVVARPDGHRDADYVGELVQSERVTVLHFVPSMLRLFLERPRGEQCRTVRQVYCSGEALPIDAVNRFFASIPQARLTNLYGPTEAAVEVTYWDCVAQDPRGIIPIGRPVANTRMYVLDDKLALLPVGAIGELYIAGVQVCMGYVSRPDLTAERFLPDPFHPDQRMYKTGDLCRWLDDGAIEYMGRADHQVKIRGFRIELGEIETELMNHPEVAQCVVVARDVGDADLSLVAYLVAGAGQTPSKLALKALLASKLPEYMVPRFFVFLPVMPLLSSGKTDRNALPLPSTERPEMPVPYMAPTNPHETTCCQVFANVLNIDKVGRNDNFFELGGNSLLAMRVLEQLRQATGKTLSAPTIFESPDPAGLAGHLLGSGAVNVRAVRRHKRASGLDEAIAIIGMAGRFPGAVSVQQLWDNLLAGKDAITKFSPESLDPSIPRDLRDDPDYVLARGIIDGVEMFDNAFFGISARESEITDPQHRILLELAWECMERAGYAPDRCDVPVGVYVGVNTPTYMQNNVLAHPQMIENIGAFQAMVGNDKDYAATRIAHKLNLHGPALAVNTACSTSLVAIAQAVDGLRLGRCDMALAGAASVVAPPRSGYLYEDGAMLSRDGHTRSFDVNASGTTFNDGAGLVLLKRLSDALADGDPISAVIRGIATNNDGGGKASFTAPSVAGQAAVVAAAHADANIDPRTISYVESHGTATPLGDPVEVEALTRAFRQTTSDTGFCRIGSVKSNVGHLVTAAGVTGLIKTALSLQEELLPPTIHFTAPNPKIDFANSPFVVNHALTPWPRGGQPRRAGVSSFGVGGTNAHAVLEEAPLQAASPAAQSPQLIMLSAKSRSALDTLAAQLADHLQVHPELNLADVAHTLRVGRSSFAHRLCVVGSTATEVVAALRTADHPLRSQRQVGAVVPPLVWVFPGQGAQYAGMGREAYSSDQTFRVAFDVCMQALQKVLPFDLQARMFSGDDASLVSTDVTQPATFCIEYALGQSWLARGYKPAAMIGHSVGEFAAAVLSGIMTLEHAAALVAKRGLMMRALPGGSMLSVRLPADRVLTLLPPELSLASDNGPTACVVAGPTPLIEAFGKELEAQGTVVRMLQTSHAFHSAMMDAAVAPFEAEVRKATLSAPQIPLISTLTGTWMTTEDATDPHYWARHLREPVRFSSAVRVALAAGETAFLEIGPRATLATLLRQHNLPGTPKPVAFASLGDSAETEVAQLMLGQGQLWCLGLAMQAPSAPQGQRRVPLPSYPFERKRFWLEAPAASAVAAVSADATAPAAVASTTAPAAPVASAASALPNTSSATHHAPTMQASHLPSAAPGRRPQLVARLQTLFEDVAGTDFSDADNQASFMELGLDSLSLTQAALKIKKTFSVPLSFRQLMEKYRSFGSLAEFLDQQMPTDPVTAAPVAVAAPATQAAAAAALTAPVATAYAAAAPMQPLATGMQPLVAGGSFVQQVISQQMQLMAQQLALLSGAPMAAAPVAVPVAMPAEAATAIAAAAPAATRAPATEEKAAPMVYDVKKAFGAIARIHTTASEVTERQQVRLQAFMRRYAERTQKSKAYTVQHRDHMADPRVVNGFRPMIKEIIYQIVVERTKGAYMWDLDGNQYVDVLNGFGMNMLGWQPDFINDAVHKQVELGYEIGPQHPLAGEVADLICELTGFDRAGLCNTGSEAVMAAIRIARTVTGRNTVVAFAGSYHGTFDEVLVRAGRGGRGIPAAPGIMSGMFGDIYVLDYGTPEALEFIRTHADDLAAVLVEPVQSRRPDFQPIAFLKEVRSITEQSGCCMIFDEVITGFRSALGGTQELFGIRGDLACYGKVIGGGFPVGVIAGKREFMDALDGGAWQYGDDSIPSVGVTYFAGTFVRHPLALAAAKASLLHFKEQGPKLQQTLTRLTQEMADELNSFCRGQGAPLEVRTFASLWRVSWLEDHPLQDLLFAMMRNRGVHILDNFPCFMTTAHTPQDIAVIKKAFKESVAELQECDFIPRHLPAGATALDASQPPVAGARLGRDESGKPAWFVANPEVPGKYIKMEAA